MVRRPRIRRSSRSTRSGHDGKVRWPFGDLHRLMVISPFVRRASDCATLGSWPYGPSRPWSGVRGARETGRRRRLDGLDEVSRSMTGRAFSTPTIPRQTSSGPRSSRVCTRRFSSVKRTVAPGLGRIRERDRGRLGAEPATSSSSSSSRCALSTASSAVRTSLQDAGLLTPFKPRASRCSEDPAKRWARRSSGARTSWRPVACERGRARGRRPLARDAAGDVRRSRSGGSSSRAPAHLGTRRSRRTSDCRSRRGVPADALAST